MKVPKVVQRAFGRILLRRLIAWLRSRRGDGRKRGRRSARGAAPAVCENRDRLLPK